MDKFKNKYTEKIISDPAQVPFLDFQVNWDGSVASPIKGLKAPVQIDYLYEQTDKSISKYDYHMAWEELRDIGKSKNKNKVDLKRMYAMYIDAHWTKGFRNFACFDRHFKAVFGTRIPDYFREKMKDYDFKGEYTKHIGLDELEPLEVVKPIPSAPSPSAPSPSTTITGEGEREVHFGNLSIKLSNGSLSIGSVDCDKLLVKGDLFVSVGSFVNGRLNDVVIRCDK